MSSASITVVSARHKKCSCRRWFLSHYSGASEQASKYRFCGNVTAVPHPLVYYLEEHSQAASLLSGCHNNRLLSVTAVDYWAFTTVAYWVPQQHLTVSQE